MPICITYTNHTSRSMYKLRFKPATSTNNVYVCSLKEGPILTGFQTPRMSRLGHYNMVKIGLVQNGTNPVLLGS